MTSATMTPPPQDCRRADEGESLLGHASTTSSKKIQLSSSTRVMVRLGVAVSLAVMVALVALASQGGGVVFPKHAIMGMWMSGPGGMLQPPYPAVPNPTSTFTLHTQCKSDEIKEAWGGDFWIQKIVGAYIVRNNYGVKSFFTKETALKMNRAELGDGEYGYTLTTDQVNWEWGFAFEREDGNMYYEIGQVGGAVPAGLAEEPCTQMYGAYFNRVMTYEADRTNVEYRFGTCEATCPAGYVDTSYEIHQTAEDVPACPAKSDVGVTDDARLFVLYSALMYASGDPSDGFNPPGRAVASRNANQEDTKDKAHWYVASIPYQVRGGTGYQRMGLVELEVDRDPVTGSTGVCMRQFLRKELAAPCTTITCDASNYDISAEATSGTTDTGIVAALLEYSKLQLGDALPDEKNIEFPAGTYLPSNAPFKFLDADEWGDDMDVRRLILQSGSLCGAGIWSNHCVNMGKAVVDTSFTPSKTEKRYIFSVQSGRGGLKNVKVAVTKNAAHEVFIQALDAGWIQRGCAVDSSQAEMYKCDVNSHTDLATVYNQDGVMDTPGGYGVGFVKYTLAPEMLISLRG